MQGNGPLFPVVRMITIVLVIMCVSDRKPKARRGWQKRELGTVRKERVKRKTLKEARLKKFQEVKQKISNEANCVRPNPKEHVYFQGGSVKENDRIELLKTCGVQGQVKTQIRTKVKSRKLTLERGNDRVCSINESTASI